MANFSRRVWPRTREPTLHRRPSSVRRLLARIGNRSDRKSPLGIIGRLWADLSGIRKDRSCWNSCEREIPRLRQYAAKTWHTQRAPPSSMRAPKIAHWEGDSSWIGYLEEFPDYWTQGETLEDLQSHFRDLHVDLTSAEPPGTRRVADIAVARDEPRWSVREPPAEREKGMDAWRNSASHRLPDPRRGNRSSEPKLLARRTA